VFWPHFLGLQVAQVPHTVTTQAPNSNKKLHVEFLYLQHIIRKNLLKN
jgi:hypothetical protein